MEFDGGVHRSMKTYPTLSLSVLYLGVSLFFYQREIPSKYVVINILMQLIIIIIIQRAAEYTGSLTG